jgi:hypothetical protein
MPMVLDQSVQHLMAERMTLRQAGVLEVILTIMRSLIAARKSSVSFSV